MILIQLQFNQVYLVEGYKPICMRLIVHYSIENDVQYYLWPIRIIAKGKLINCSEPSDGKQFFLPVRNIALSASLGIVMVVSCFIGCAFHSVRLFSFITTGKVCLKNKLLLNTILLLENKGVCYYEETQQAIMEVLSSKITKSILVE